MKTTFIPEFESPENFEEERELQSMHDPRPKEFTTEQILKLALDLKERVNTFMNAAYRNKETTNMVDYNIAQAFLVTLDKTEDQIKAIKP